MRRVKEKIYDHLYACQQQCGGYTGKDIEEIARLLDCNRKTIKRDLEKWAAKDLLFAELKYIGKRSIPITWGSSRAAASWGHVSKSITFV